MQPAQALIFGNPKAGPPLMIPAPAARAGFTAQSARLVKRCWAGVGELAGDSLSASPVCDPPELIGNIVGVDARIDQALQAREKEI
jgi:hypothetical protein